jgi:hypothetical protein
VAIKGDDYFAELYVAGVLARAGWNVYFPHRDEGFDFIISKLVEGKIVIRPVQVKGKYPEPNKTDKPVYGYIGQLTQKHPEMVLAIPYFAVDRAGTPPQFIAYMPPRQIKPHKRGCRCLPAEFKEGCPKPRKYYSRFMSEDGIKLLESNDWNNLEIADPLESEAQYAEP